MTQHDTEAWAPRPPAAPKKPRRWFLWTFIAVQLLFLLWIGYGLANFGADPGDCGTLDAKTCNDAYDAGAAIGVGIIIAVWAAIDLILGITYAVIRSNRRRQS